MVQLNTNWENGTAQQRTVHKVGAACVHTAQQQDIKHLLAS